MLLRQVASLLVLVFLKIDLQASFRSSSPSFCVAPSAGNCITGLSPTNLPEEDTALVTPVSPEGGRGVRVEVEWRALGEAGQWSLCATRLLLYSVPLVVRDGAIVLAAPLLESDKILFQIVKEVKGLLSNVHAKCAVISS